MYRFETLLRSFEPGRVELLLTTEGGFFDAADWLMSAPEFLEWLRFREESVHNWVGALFRAVKAADPAAEVACGPRTGAFAPLAGYNLARLRDVTDFLCPKLYFWARGFDGLKGTVARWARTLCEWNEGLAESRALAVVYRLFGFSIPGIDAPADLDQPLDARFFQTVVSGEIARSVIRAGGADRLHPWTGLHHGGIRISTVELEWMLGAIEQSPLTSLIYWHYETFSRTNGRCSSATSHHSGSLFTPVRYGSESRRSDALARPRPGGSAPTWFPVRVLVTSNPIGVEGKHLQLKESSTARVHGITVPDDLLASCATAAPSGMTPPVSGRGWRRTVTSSSARRWGRPWRWQPARKRCRAWQKWTRLRCLPGKASSPAAVAAGR